MEIEQKFHDYCEGCQIGQLVFESSAATCENYRLCQRLWERLSTIRNDPPDLMKQVAAICREKGISGEEAVELFKKL